MDVTPVGRTPAAGSDPGLRLAPHAVVLDRSATELQVGVEPSVVVPRSYDRLVRALARGDAPEALRQTAAADGLRVDALADLLGALDDARLLVPPSSVAHRPVRVVGAGPLAGRTAGELAAAGFGTVYLADLPGHAAPGRRPRAPRAAAVDGPGRLEVLAASLTDDHPGVRVRRTRHFAKPEGDAVALTVVVADGPEPDRLVPDVLREQGAPHLLVRGTGDEAVVGPLVVPGVTSCVRCADLSRRDADPRWPWLLAQLTRLRVDPSRTLLAWAAVTAAVQALAFVTHGAAETLGHTLELGGAEHAMRLRGWSVHPECPCRWEAAAVDAGRGAS